MNLVESMPVTNLPVMQPEEIKPINKVKKKRAPKHDFGDGRGRVFAHRHDNGKGWVEDSAKVEDSVYVGPRAEIFHCARVSGQTRLEGNARIFGHAVVTNKVLVKKNAQIYGRATVRDEVQVTDNVLIYDNAVIGGLCELYDRVRVCEHAHVFASCLRGSSRILGEAHVVRSCFMGEVTMQNRAVAINATLTGQVSLSGYCQILNSTINLHNAGVSIHDFAVIADNTQIMVPVIIKNHAVVVRSVFLGFDWSNQPVRSIENQTVITNRRFNTYASLNEFITNYDTRGGHAHAAAAVGQPAAAQRGPISVQPVQRRVMRLQEEVAV